MEPLRRALEDYDGKHKDVLEFIRDGMEPLPDVLDEAIDLAADDAGRIAAGATWLFRAWVEAGAEVGARRVGRLVKVLPQVTEDHARLHVCQTLRSLAVPARQADALAAFLEDCRASGRPFLRAWAVDGLCRLAAQHPRFDARAETALQAARQDPAASVRARVRRIEAGD